MSSKEPCEGGEGSLFEIIDDLCRVTNTLVNAVKNQEIMIEQAKIAGIMFDKEYTEEKEEATEELDKIERKIKRL